MTSRWLPTYLSSRPELRPTRALLNPAWLAALAVLALNDHVLKGAGVLPGVVTGKLSDVAGLVVAPALLAALLGVRSRRGLFVCGAAVGLVFSLINLSPACADAWSWLMGLVGFPWTITTDPTDLLTLPALALGWRVLVPAMLPATRPARTRPHPAEATAAALGTLLCVATSESEPNSEGGWDSGWETGTGDSWEPITADVYIHNDSEDTITVRLSELRTDVMVDCLNASQAPGQYFTAALFDEGATWTLPPHTNGAARPVSSRDRDCYAVLLEGDTLAPTILFWQANEIPSQSIPGSITDDDHLPGAVILTADADHRVSISGSERDILFPQRAPDPGSVLPQPDLTRVDWSEVPVGVQEIAALDPGSDDCIGVTFADVTIPRWYLCVPEGSFPFQVGEFVDLSESGSGVSVRLVAGPNDPGPAIDRLLTVSRGALPVVTDGTLAASPDFGVPLAPDPICGTVARPMELDVAFSDQPIVSLRAGESATLADGAHSLLVHAVHAERRLIVDPTCAEGPDGLNDDLEVVAVWQALEP